MSHDAAPRSSAHLDRRSFLAGSASLGLAAAMPAQWRAPALAEPAPGSLLEPRAEAVIQIYLGGGMSHIDSFDPKPDAPVDTRGPFRSVPTKLDDVRFSELCRNLAKVADKLTVVRSMTHTEAAHERGRHNMLTGYRPSPAIVYPSFGAVVSHELGVRNDLPPYVCVPGAREPDLGTGYLSSAYGPFSVGGEPSSSGFQVKDLGPSSKLDDARKERRRRMLAELDSGFDGAADGISATHEFYRQAWNLIDSPKAQEAFKIEQEDGKTRDRYGRTTIGQRLLLARRLVAAGVRFVAIPSGGWDHHERISDAMRRQLPPVDQALAALISDLDERGMLDKTMVVLSTEFGRTPRVNRTQGRDHWPRVFSLVAAGGGLKRGYVHGASDPSGGEPSERPTSPADFAATMFTQLGIDPHKRLMSPGDRPIDIVRGGSVVRELLA
ncbi:MAG: DUF1501 domain-containing protein [Planctomycetota bacterium]